MGRMSADLPLLGKDRLSVGKAGSHQAKKRRYAIDRESFQRLDKSRIIAVLCYLTAKGSAGR